MKIPKKPIDPEAKHYSVSIEVYERSTGKVVASVQNVPAVSPQQAIRIAGMRLVQSMKHPTTKQKEKNDPILRRGY